MNKVTESGIITINLEEYLPKEEMEIFDIKEFLFMSLVLKEKDFRTSLQQTDWQQYENKNIAVTCSADAIIPLWAYMLVASYLQPFANEIVFGNKDELEKALVLKSIATINANDFSDKRVVIKGCGNAEIHESAYLEITKKLRPVVKSIMYGEPCSTVPIYKKK